MKELKMKRYNMIAAKMSALLSGKTDNNKQLTGEEILPPAQNRSIKEVRFTYSSLVKAFEDQREKQKKLLQSRK